MLSNYARYLTEKTSDKIIETDKGFVTYRYVDEKNSIYRRSLHSPRFS